MQIIWAIVIGAIAGFIRHDRVIDLSKKSANDIGMEKRSKERYRSAKMTW